MPGRDASLDDSKQLKLKCSKTKGTGVTSKKNNTHSIKQTTMQTGDVTVSPPDNVKSLGGALDNNFTIEKKMSSIITVMPFGRYNSPVISKRLIKWVLGQLLLQICLQYLNDWTVECYRYMKF